MRRADVLTVQARCELQRFEPKGRPFCIFPLLLLLIKTERQLSVDDTCSPAAVQAPSVFHRHVVEEEQLRLNAIQVTLRVGFWQKGGEVGNSV